MEISKISSVINQIFASNVKEDKQQKTPEQIKEGKKKLTLALAATAAIAAAGVGVAVAVKKGKNNGKETEAVQNAVNKLQEAIQAKTSGTVTSTLKNGDTLVTELKDGKIISSERKGLVNFVKKYQYGENGTLKITTDFADGTKCIFDKAADGSHKITENGIITKAMYNNEDTKVVNGFDEVMYNNKDTIVVNSFDKEYGILNGTNVFDKDTKEITRIAQSAASDAEKIRNSSPIHLLKDENITECTRYKNGILKTATLKDGTKLEFDTEGHISKKIKPDGQVSTLRELPNEYLCDDKYDNELDMSFRSCAYCLEFPDGSREYYDKVYMSPYGYDILGGEVTADGTRKFYYTNGILSTIRKPNDCASKIKYGKNGQLLYKESGGTINHYRKNGTLSAVYFKEGPNVQYAGDGITKAFEHFKTICKDR